jgi:hypothetical protein
MTDEIVTDARVAEILDELNRRTGDPQAGEVDWWDWIADVDEFDGEATIFAPAANLVLVDGTSFVWQRDELVWVAVRPS